jgi:hypothetical protein
MPGSFLTAHPFRILLAGSLTFGEGWIVRAFVIDPMPHFGGAAGLRFLDPSVCQVAPVIHDIFLEGTRLKTKVRHPPQSGWLSERGRLKGGYPGYLVAALKRASAHDPTYVPIHPLPLGRGCIGGLVQVQTRQ